MIKGLAGVRRAALTRSPARRAGSTLLAIAFIPSAVVMTFVGYETVQHPSLLRPVTAAVIAGILAVIAVRTPRIAVLLVLGFLVFLGFLRRFLIPASGWTSYDPLLLVGPVIAVILLARLAATERRLVGDSVVGLLVMGLLVLGVIETPNPRAGGLPRGMVGLFLLAIPILWFFVGRKLADRDLVSALLGAVIAWAVIDGVYGLAQALTGPPSWDAAWLDLAGYPSLRVGGALRPFGTFASSPEYATYVAIGLVLCLSLLLHRRWLALLPVPLLAGALILDSTRAILVVAILGVVIIAGLVLHNTGAAVAAILAGVAITLGALSLLGPAVSGLANATGSPLIAHQVAGLVYPLDPDESTLGLHVAAVVDGLKFSLANPLGAGTAVAMTAAGPVQSSETDVANAFVSLGLLGGILLLVVIGTTVIRAVNLYRMYRGAVLLGVVGLLVVTLGQWLNGGHYAVAPLVWFLVGWIDIEWSRHGSGADRLAVARHRARMP